jgi:hypothetical protein
MKNSHLLPIIFIMAHLFLLGCGSYKLIGSMSDGYLPDELQWKHDKEVRLPKNNNEALVIRVAADHHALTDGNKTIVYVSDISGGQKIKTLVAVFEAIPAHKSTVNPLFAGFGDISDKNNNDDPTFSPKRVERYLVQSGRIHDSMGPSIEPFPDEQLESAVTTAAMQSVKQGGSELMLVTGWSQLVLLKGQGHGCSVEIICYRANAGGPGEELFRKSVNGCMHD